MNPETKPLNPNIISRRPAESFGVGGAIALLVARLLGVNDADTILALAMVIGFVPSGITWLVDTVQRRSGVVE
jgi:hypothetical protein